MMKTPFYSQGLRFSCTRCSACCRYESGYVFLSQNDVSCLAKELQMEYNALIETYCRWVPAVGGRKQLSLKEKAGFDCIFWKDGCTVYKSRPLQCRSFPFWESVMASREAWDGLDCPGIGSGELFGKDRIEALLQKRRDEPVLEK
jgi:Fe-S-cluster containining protein